MLAFLCLYISVVIYILGGKSGWFGGSVLRGRPAYHASRFLTLSLSLLCLVTMGGVL